MFSDTGYLYTILFIRNSSRDRSYNRDCNVHCCNSNEKEAADCRQGNGIGRKRKRSDENHAHIQENIRMYINYWYYAMGYTDLFCDLNSGRILDFLIRYDRENWRLGNMRKYYIPEPMDEFLMENRYAGDQCL